VALPKLAPVGRVDFKLAGGGKTAYYWLSWGNTKGEIVERDGQRGHNGLSASFALSDNLSLAR
jgi:hypothetical protein